MRPTPGPVEVRTLSAQEIALDAPSGDPDLGYTEWTDFAVFYGADDFGAAGREKVRANASLAADAFNTYATTGRTPSELADELQRVESSGLALSEELAKMRAQRDGLIEKARAVIERWESPRWKEAAPTADCIYAMRNFIESIEGSK